MRLVWGAWDNQLPGLPVLLGPVCATALPAAGCAPGWLVH